jgi:hypothetical protein
MPRRLSRPSWNSGIFSAPCREREVETLEAAQTYLENREQRADEIRQTGRDEYVKIIKRLGIARTAWHLGTTDNNLKQPLRLLRGLRKV